MNKFNNMRKSKYKIGSKPVGMQRSPMQNAVEAAKKTSNSKQDLQSILGITIIPMTDHAASMAIGNINIAKQKLGRNLTTPEMIGVIDQLRSTFNMLMNRANSREEMNDAMLNNNAFLYISNQLKQKEQQPNMPPPWS